ncbi:MAG TPA: hypothetical protein VFY23_11585 [Candidatus Limnocylindrales bacterium]|nr:hypothetical protein [Candidatus Limnocylindrales bacterium]
MPRPVVLLLGGFLTSPFLYRPFVRRLGARGVADVVTASVWLPDWLLAARHGLGPILTRSGRALLEASARSERLSGGAPVLVVGHSAGGMSARLLTCPEPFAGRRLNASGRIGAIVTLGTPHHVGADGEMGRRVGAEAATFANRVVPGAAFAPRVGYLAVGSRAVVGRPEGSLNERRAWRVYQDLLHDPAATAIPGDGLVPLESALLEGVPHVVFDDALHGQWPGDWYGSERFLDEWWWPARAAWEEALRRRVELALGDVAQGG